MNSEIIITIECILSLIIALMCLFLKKYRYEENKKYVNISP